MRKPLLAVGILLLSSGCAETQEDPSAGASVKVHEVVYEETLPDGQKFSVLRHEVAHVPLPKAEIERRMAKARKQFPTGQVTYSEPDRVSRYSLFQDSADGRGRRLLWQRTIPEYLKPFFRTAPVRKFHDVYLESGTLVVLHAFGSAPLVGEVVPLNDPKGGESYRPEWVMPVSIKVSVTRGTPFVESATIEGSLKSRNLSVVARKLDGETARFIWKDAKWQEQIAPESPTRRTK